MTEPSAQSVLPGRLLKRRGIIVPDCIERSDIVPGRLPQSAKFRPFRSAKGVRAAPAAPPHHAQKQNRACRETQLERSATKRVSEVLRPLPFLEFTKTGKKTSEKRGSQDRVCRAINCIFAQKKFRGEIRYSARTRVIIDEKSVRMRPADENASR